MAAKERDSRPAEEEDLLAGSSWVEVEADPVHLRRERERARKLRSSAFWQRKLARGVCGYCGESFAARDLTMDHIVPVARGGRSVRGNVVPSCKACNARKKLLTPAEQLLLARRAAEREGGGGGQAGG